MSVAKATKTKKSTAVNDDVVIGRVGSLPVTVLDVAGRTIGRRNSVQTTINALSALYAIRSGGWHSRSQTFLGLSSVQVSVLSKYMKRRRLISITSDPSDRRLRLFRVTTKGRGLLKRLDKYIKRG